MNPATGSYTIKNRDGGTTKAGVKNISKEPIAFEDGDPCIVGFYYSDRNKPFILGPAGKILPKDFGATLPGLYDWNRQRATLAAYYNTTGDLNTPTAIPATDTWLPAGIVRAFDGALWTTDTADLVRREPDTDPTTTTLPGSIVALWAHADSPWVLVEVEGGGVGYEDGFADGFTAGYAATDGIGLSGLDWGYNDAINSYGYTPAANRPATPTADGDVDYQDGFADGFESGWLAAYDEGYILGGGTPE